MSWSGEPDTLTKGFVAHRNVLSGQIIASAGAEIPGYFADTNADTSVS